MYLRKYFDMHADKLYFLFRVIVGLGFFLHGIQKVQGIMDGKIMLMSLFGLAGVIEVVGGIFLIVGLFTRYTAFVTAVEMIVAYAKAHAPSGLNPLMNKGEAAMLYFAVFLVLMAYGAGKWAIDNKLAKKRR